MMERRDTVEEFKKEIIIKILKNSGQYLLFLLASIIILSATLMLFKIPMSNIHFCISSLIAIIPFYLLNKNNKLNEIVISIILAFIVITFSIVINKNYIDLSWDGNTYHKDAVGLIKNKWNPIYDNYIEFYKKINTRDMSFIGDEIKTTHGFWQTYYAKGTWYIGASIYSITNDIETGKAFNIIVVYTTFTLVLSMLYQIRKKIIPSIIIASITAFNPIMVPQMFSYYNDGILCNLLLLVIFYMTLFASESKSISKKEIYFILCSILLILINVKFTGFGYAGIFCVPYFLIFVYKKIKEKNFKEIIKSGSIFACTVLFSVCVVGFSPYITNMKEGLPIFYPLMGENKVDIVSYNQPVQFATKSTLFKFAKSILSETSNINRASGLKPKTKIPFTIKQKELDILYHPDLRIAGFGVLFSGILIISAIIIISYIIKMIIKRDKNFIYVFIPLMVSGLLILFISESWWARYTPYLYIVPIIALILPMLNNKKIDYIAFIILAIPIIINMNYFVEYNLKHNYQISKETTKRLDEAQNQKIIIIDTFNEFTGMLYNLEDRNITYKIQTTNTNDTQEFYKWVKYRIGDDKE